MPLGTNHLTVTTSANFIPEVWGPMVIKATEQNLVFRKLIWDWFENGKGVGDTIHIPNISNMAASAKAAATEVTLVSPTEVMINLLINRHDEVSFLLEDITKVQESFNLTKLYTEKTGYGLADQMDQRIVDLISSLSQTVGSVGVDLGDVAIRNGIEFLDLADAPQEKRYLVIHPTQKNALFGIEKYFDASKRGRDNSSILVKGKFGEIYGLEVFVSTQIGLSGSTRLNTMFHEEAWASAIQLGPETLVDYIQEHLGTLVTTHAIYGEVESRDAFGVWCQS